MKLILYRGKPGSSKSTSAHRMYPGIFLVENDMYHMHNGVYEWSAKNMPNAIQWCVDMVKTALKNKMDVIVANTFTKRRFVQAYKNIADEYGADFVVYRCTGNFKNVHGLSEDMVANFEKSIEDWPGEIVV